MYLAPPSKILRIDYIRNVAIVETMGAEHEAGLEYIETREVKAGDYVILYQGYIMYRISEKNALKSLKIYYNIMDVLDKEDQERVEEQETCTDNSSEDITLTQNS